MIAKEATKTTHKTSELTIVPVMLVSQAGVPRAAQRNETLENAVARGGEGEASGGEVTGGGSAAPSQVRRSDQILEQMSQRKVGVAEAETGGALGDRDVEPDQAGAPLGVAGVGRSRQDLFDEVAAENDATAPGEEEAEGQVADAAQAERGEVQAPGVPTAVGLVAVDEAPRGHAELEPVRLAGGVGGGGRVEPVADEGLSAGFLAGGLEVGFRERSPVSERVRKEDRGNVVILCNVIIETPREGIETPRCGWRAARR